MDSTYASYGRGIDFSGNYIDRLIEANPLAKKYYDKGKFEEAYHVVGLVY